MDNLTSYKNKFKIGIFGCTADPFTVAHKEICLQLLRERAVDKIYIVPTIVDYHRDNKDVWLSYQERIDLIYDAFRDEKYINGRGDASNVLGDKIVVDESDVGMMMGIKNIDLREEVQSSWRFYNTLLRVIGMTGSSVADDEEFEYFTIIGSDSLKNFTTWYRYKDILKLSKIIVIQGRNGDDVESDIPFIEFRLDKDYVGVSASNMRAKYSSMENGLNMYREIELFGRKEQVLQHTPIFDLVKMPYVDEAGFRPVKVKSNDWVMVIVECGDEYLMVNQLRYGLMERFDEFVCGIVETNENPCDAAARELEEETGIKIDKTKLEYLGKFAANPAFMSNHMHYFYVNLDKVSHEEVQQKLDEHEKLEVKWVPKIQFLYPRDSNSPCESVFIGGAILLLSDAKKV